MSGWNNSSVLTSRAYLAVAMLLGKAYNMKLGEKYNKAYGVDALVDRSVWKVPV